MKDGLRDFKFDHGGSGRSPPNDKGPSIIGPVGPYKYEQNGDDLGGDGREPRPQGYPKINEKSNPLEGLEDNERPLPTGAAQLPDSSRYAGHSVVNYGELGPDGRPIYASKDTISPISPIRRSPSGS